MTSEEYDALTDEEKRIKVAGLCGWSECHWVWSEHFQVGNIVGTKDGKQYRVTPDYLNDLNAMHEAENRALTQGIFWVDRLAEVIGSKDVSKLIHATAAQRAKAFVLTMTQEAT